MNSFDLPKVSHLTEAFIKRNQRLAYQLVKLEEDDRHVLYQASNLFSLLYCCITADIDLICKWQDLQESLFKHDGSKANRYLVYVVPDWLIKKSDLYAELTRAERDERFFRKVFVGLPDSAKRDEIEKALAHRIPLWFEDTHEVIRQFVPVLHELIADADLLRLLLQKPPSVVVKAIEEQQRYAYLLEGKSKVSDAAGGYQESPQARISNQKGPRLTGVTVQDFRCFERQSVDLDGDVVIIYGRNGTGKTTLCDALELSIFPELRRLCGDPDIVQDTKQPFAPFVRAGSNSKVARLTVTGTVGDKPFVLETKVSAHETVKLLNGAVATHESIVHFLSHNEHVHKRAFLGILLHTHFLGQHSIRDFIYGNRLDAEEQITTLRYNLLAEMFGFGEVEQLKTRLTGVLAQIKRSKVNEADHQIELAKAQLRGMQHKYGPKCRQELENSGYQLMSGPAIKRYQQAMQRAAGVFGADVITRISSPDGMPMEAYQVACDSVCNLITSRTETLEVQAADLKHLGRLMTKIGAVFPDVILSSTASVKKCVEEVRRKMKHSVDVVERAQQEIETIDAKAETLNLKSAALRHFSDRHEHYLELLGMEQKEEESLGAIQKQRKQLLQKHSDLINKLEHASQDERLITKRFVEVEQRLHKCEGLLKSCAKAKAAESVLQDQTVRLTAVNNAIAQAEQRLAQLRHEVKDREHSNSARPPLVNWEELRTNSHYNCPCCGAAYDDVVALEQRVCKQLESGRHRQELRMFLAALERENVEAIRAQLRETIRSHTCEKTELETSNNAQVAILMSFKTLAHDLGVTGSPSEETVRDIVTTHERQVEAARRELAHHAAKSLRDQVEKAHSELNAIKDDAYKTHVAQVRHEIQDMVGPIAGIVPVNERRERKNIQERLTCLTTEVASLAKRREHLLEDIRSQGVTEQKHRTFDGYVSEIESLLLKHEAFQAYTLNKASGIGEHAIEERKACYEYLKEFKDLSRVFGVLSAQERADTIANALTAYEQEKHRWQACYRAVDTLNGKLTTLSHSGLQESLAQYGPLINQVYQKFIRHDIFSALILHSKTSAKQRKRDLYLRLKSYSGDETYTPASYLSEAQLNILALSIFLTRVMYQNISALETVFIDDPIQQMDDMNAAAFVDVILGLSNVGKQIIITTCNHEFYRLVAHKLRGVSTISFKMVNLDSLEAAC